ncbi:hypothetical protein ACFUN8_32225 [Streptomyces sp. NPDC057307]|uniref:hypothetical protein n=1 Tax=Streptomyces sp. NPDC057307 TaxID=3346096 RepID=UPI00362B60CC
MGIVLVGGISFAGPAAASEGECVDAVTSTRAIDLPGLKPDTLIAVEQCLELQGATVQASSALVWQILDDVVQDRGRRFTSFEVTNRLESRLAPGEAPRTVSTKTCDFTEQLNAAWSNSVAIECAAPAAPYNSAQSWASGTTVVYDLEDDGKGPVRWEIAGASLIRG